jgi:hypothetical protein
MRTPTPSNRPPRRVVAVLGVVLAALLAGCGPHSFRQATCVDPTDDCNWSVVVVRNDSQQAVVLRGCMHHCGQGDRRLDPVTVAAGAASPRKQYGGVKVLTENLMWWGVKDTTGRDLGCLVLNGHSDKSDGDIVLVSQARPCGEHQPPVRPVGRTSVQAL